MVPFDLQERQVPAEDTWPQGNSNEHAVRKIAQDVQETVL